MRQVNPMGCPLSDPPTVRPPPERITLRLPAELAARLDEIAAKMSVTRSDVVRAMIQAALAGGVE